MSGSGSVVEHLLAKERVEGSNPFFRSRESNGDVAKWFKAGVCKTLIQRFESARRLHMVRMQARVGLFLFGVSVKSFIVV